MLLHGVRGEFGASDRRSKKCISSFDVFTLRIRVTFPDSPSSHRSTHRGALGWTGMTGGSRQSRQARAVRQAGAFRSFSRFR